MTDNRMKLYVVGFGPGSPNMMTPEAQAAISESDVVIGYSTYVDLIKTWFPHKRYNSTGMRQEIDRVEMAFAAAQQGQTVSLACSGDSAVYGMAGLVWERSEAYPGVEVMIVPGVTAALSGGAVLGAPLTNDFCVISLSDLLTPWERIEKRLLGAAMADFVVALYNPASSKRQDYLAKACDILLTHKSADTVCGIVRNIGREGQEGRILTLSELREAHVDMFTTVFVGCSETKVIQGKMVTPRGYRNV